jgi:hypothetical protein
MESNSNIEIPERIHKRLQWFLNVWNDLIEWLKWIWFYIRFSIPKAKAWFISRRPKRLQIIGIEFLTKDGMPHHMYVDEKHHIDNHPGKCEENMHCLIKKVKKIKIIQGSKLLRISDKVKVLFEEGHIFIYSQVDIRTTYLKKV